MYIERFCIVSLYSIMSLVIRREDNIKINLKNTGRKTWTRLSLDQDSDRSQQTLSCRKSCYIKSDDRQGMWQVFGEKKNACRVLEGRPEGERQLGRSRRVRIILKGILEEKSTGEGRLD
jgi:hypothetical protein